MYEVGCQKSQMVLAVAEAIVQQRAVHWLRYSHGAIVAPYRAGDFAIVGGFVGSARSAGMVAA